MRKNKNLMYMFLEFFILLLVVNIINQVFCANDPGFLKLKFNPFLLIVIVIAAEHGFVMGFISSIIVCINLFWYEMYGILTRNSFDKFLELSDKSLLLGVIVTGVVVGMISQIFLNREKERQNEIEKLNKVNSNLNKVLNIEHKAKEMLEKRIVGSNATVKAISANITKLYSYDEDRIMNSFLKLLKKYFSIKQAFICEKDDDIKVKYFYGYKDVSVVAQNIPNIRKYINNVFRNSEPCILPSIEKQSFKMPLCIFAINNIKDQKCSALVIESMDFMNFNISNLNTIENIIKILEHALYNKILYDNNLNRMLESDMPGVFNNSFLEKFVSEENLRAKEYEYAFSHVVFSLQFSNEYGLEYDELIRKLFVSMIKKNMNYKDKLFFGATRNEYHLLAPYKNTDDIKNNFNNINNEFKNILKHIDERAQSVSIKVTYKNENHVGI